MATTGSADLLEVLSPRERDVLALVAEGRSNRGIAAALCIAERTVEAHTAQIFLKLRIDDEPISNRRVRAAVAFLRSTIEAGGGAPAGAPARPPPPPPPPGPPALWAPGGAPRGAPPGPGRRRRSGS